MNTAVKSSEIIKCLHEIGMPREKINQFAVCLKNGDKNESLRILNRYRDEKVRSMHCIYKDLECLDYLIAEAGKEGQNAENY